MRVIVGLALAAVIAWGGWWYVASRTAQAALTGWLVAHEEAGPAGWRVGHEGLSLAGFPNRIDFQIDRPRLEWPAHGIAWSAPFLQIFALSYKPTHQIIVWPHEQLLTLFGEELAIVIDDMRASITVTADGPPELDQVVVVAQAPRLESANGAKAAAETLRLATRPTAGRPLARDLALEVTGLAVSAPALPLPSPPGTLHLELIATLDRPLDGDALAGATPRIEAIEISSAFLRWGPLRLDARGRVTRDEAGRLRGAVELSSDDWRPVLALLSGSGLLRGQEELLLQSLTESEPRLVFDIRGGAIWLGPLRLASLP